MSGLEVKNLRVARGAFTVEVEQLHVRPGEILALCGPSGSGKTTVLEAIAGFIPAQGEVTVDGKPIHTLPPEKRRVGMVFQRAALFRHLNVEDNVAFGLRVRGEPIQERRELAREWLSKVGLEGFGTRSTDSLSEGQAQRVALARVLAVGFPVLLLDEPFSALDSKTRADLRVLIKLLVKELNVAAIFVSHQKEDVVSLADKIVLQEEGKLKS